MTDDRFAFRVPKWVADKHIRAKGQAEAKQDYKPITWTEWFDNDPRVKERQGIKAVQPYGLGVEMRGILDNSGGTDNDPRVKEETK